MIRLALIPALLMTAACAERVETPYGTVTKPHAMLMGYGGGEPGCWAERGQAKPLAAWADLTIPRCRTWALDYNHRVLVTVLTENQMEDVRLFWANQFPESDYAQARELRGYARPHQNFYGWQVVLNELAFIDGTWPDLLDHELGHIEKGPEEGH